MNTASANRDSGGTVTRGYRVVAVEGIDGSGKSTLVGELARLLGPGARTERLSPRMAGVFRELVDEPSDQQQRYQDVIPGDLRRAAYLVDAISQFHYLAHEYEAYDWLVFDRWLTTYQVYCPGRSVHDEWYARLAADLPQPDLLIHLRTPPETAFERILGRGDWTVDHWSGAELLTDLRRLDALYTEALADVPHLVVDGSLPAADVTRRVLDLVLPLRAPDRAEVTA